MYGDKALKHLIENYRFETVLDVGSGKGLQAEYMRALGKKVITLDINPERHADITVEVFYHRSHLSYDCVWCSHVLEHQKNVNKFLESLRMFLFDGGILAITVPPAKDEIVGGHLTIWNAGLLLYNLVMAGFDCREADVMTYENNISAILEKKAITEDVSLNHAKGDIDKLVPYLPPCMSEGVNGKLPDLRKGQLWVK